MEIDNNSPLATIRNSTWIQNSICETTSTLETTEKALICRRPVTRKYSNPKILNGRDDRSITIPKQELPFQLFYFTGTDQEKANFGLSKTQQLSTSGTFQDGGRAGITRDNRRKRLHLQNRLKRCVRRHTCPSRLSRLPKLRKSRHCISLQITRFRIKCGTLNFFKNYEIRHRTIVQRRSSLSLLFRRYLSTRKVEREDATINLQSSPISTEIGFHHQFQQELVNSCQDSRVLRFSVQHQEDGDFGPKPEDNQPVEEDQTIGIRTISILQMDSEFVEKDDSNDPSSWGSIIIPKIPSKRPI
ncbi:hypothetical protein G6F43_005035 [Rhizopus delemar]|nr:hypothetical protein G6F43_005035 [Rhizopus delemar]